MNSNNVTWNSLRLPIFFAAPRLRVKSLSYSSLRFNKRARQVEHSITIDPVAHNRERHGS